MTLNELRQLLTAADRDSWHKIDCFDPGAGPSYGVFLVSPSKGDPAEVIARHHSRATLINDVSVSLAWGMETEKREDYQPEWLKQRPVWNVSGGIFAGDVFYCGQFVDRVLYTVVDGGRCKLPLPNEDMTVPQWDYLFVALLNDLAGVSDYDRYIRQAGIATE